MFEKDSSQTYSFWIHVLDESGKERHDIKIFPISNRQLIKIKLLSSNLFSPSFKISKLISQDNMRLWLYFLNNTSHLKTVEVTHNPIIVNRHFLQMKIIVIGVELKMHFASGFFAGIAIDEVDEIAIVEGF